MGGRHHCTQRATGIVMTHELIPQRVQVYVDNCIIAIGKTRTRIVPTTAVRYRPPTPWASKNNGHGATP